MTNPSATNSTIANMPDYAAMLHAALTEPGTLHKAYSIFHNYSIGNAWLALWTCACRNIEPGPINTYKGWQELGRQVRKGEKAISLVMPVTCKSKRAGQDAPETGTTETIASAESESTFTRFILRPNWFVLSQTEGAEYITPTIPNWSDSLALTSLNITRIPFTHANGNTQGYATIDREVAISPIAVLPHKTLFHEIAHIVLGHLDTSTLTDDEYTPKSIREVEAESVAYILCESLQLPGAEYCRGYIREWLGNESGTKLPEKSAQRIFAAANKILKAGQTGMIEKSIDKD